MRNPELIPTKNPGYNTYKGIYRNNFAVSSSGTLEQTISLELEITKNEFKTNAIANIATNRPTTIHNALFFVNTTSPLESWERQPL